MESLEASSLGVVAVLIGMHDCGFSCLAALPPCRRRRVERSQKKKYAPAGEEKGNARAGQGEARGG